MDSRLRSQFASAGFARRAAARHASDEPGRTGAGVKTVGRVQTIQVLRGVAALLVVLNHATNVIDARADFVHGTWIDYPALNNLGAIGVDIFFVISGFAMAEAVRAKPDRSAARFLIERFVRIMPLFWTMSVVAAAASFALGTPMSLASAANTITMLPIFPQEHYAAPILVVGWTLAFEWMFYLLIAAGVLVSRRHAVTIAMALAIALALLSLEPTERPPLGKLVFNTMYAEFGFGIAIAWLWRAGRLNRRPVKGWLLLALAAAGIGWTLWRDISYFAYLDTLFAGHADRSRALLWGVPSAAFTAGALALGEWWLARGGGRGGGWQWALRIGDASFSIYLVHLPLMWIAEAALPAVSVPGEMIVALLSLASVGVGLAVYRWGEQPLLTISRGVVSGRPAAELMPAAA
jgi:peptidoglycan/LPS O-acetylase OafA/YrhL